MVFQLTWPEKKYELIPSYLPVSFCINWTIELINHSIKEWYPIITEQQLGDGWTREFWYSYNYINTKVLLTVRQYSNFFLITSSPNALSHIYECICDLPHKTVPICYLFTCTQIHPNCPIQYFWFLSQKMVYYVRSQRSEKLS